MVDGLVSLLSLFAGIKKGLGKVRLVPVVINLMPR